MKLFNVYPLFDITPAKALGSLVWDENGQEYLDLYGGHAVISVGHSHPHYVERLTKQLNNIGFYSNSVKIPMQEELAEKLALVSGYPDYSLFLCNSGAEANENALKLASFQTGRKKIVAVGKSFHGRTSLAVASTDDASIVAPVNETDNVSFIPLNDLTAIEKAVTAETCAVIIEGIQGVGGVNIPTAQYLQALRARCNEVGAVLILDEIQSGYGRSGKFFAHQHAAVKADIITMAKGMGNGFPVGGLLISPMFIAKHGMLGTTFGGNYLACAAALAVLEIIEKESLIENAAKMGDYLVTKLAGIDGVKEIRYQGLMIGIELHFPCADLRKTLLNKHHIFTGAASNKNTLRILPSLAITETELDKFINAFEQEMQQVLIKTK